MMWLIKDMGLENLGTRWPKDARRGAQTEGDSWSTSPTSEDYHGVHAKGSKG